MSVSDRTGGKEKRDGTVILRRMGRQDAPAAACLEAAVSSEAWSEQAFLDAVDAPDAIYVVAECGGQIIGCCGLWKSFEEADICNVAVREGYRRQGVARRMLLFLMDLGSRAGIEHYTLEVRRNNLPALRLYEKLGFSVEAVRRNFYENPAEDALLLWKR